ncbi:hypothetical protein WUBG_17742 [Wuchereria bancrofti]|uniref:Uncharacterized protein n=1 Tax=Wuchereria bancrofti TaxID=6293 RepID=J9DPA1_WUCBA|nr:hypothetical protein WUBG_17742 [Wuchereria bancrofti]
MNITDIDDKIIKRARQLYLLENYTSGEFGELSITKGHCQGHIVALLLPELK